MNPLVVSYYTEGTPYEKEATDLASSCLEFGIEHEISKVPNLGSWSANCCYKPEFLLNLLEKHNRPLIWTDVDSVFVNKPIFFDTCKSDIALKINHDLPVDAKSKILTGTLFINNTAAVKKLLRFWKDDCQSALKHNPLIFDQAILAKILFEKMPEITACELPPGYLQIIDHPKDQLTPQENVVIIHYQASRLYQKMIDGELSPILTDWLSSEELKKIRTN